MGKFWDKIVDAYYTIKWKIEDAWDDVKNFFGNKKYNDDSLDDQVDADKHLETFRNRIEEELNGIEEDCICEVDDLFSDLIEKTQESFPDMVEIIENIREEAKDDLRGIGIQYVKEHLSKNDIEFRNVLEMLPGSEKIAKLDSERDRIINEGKEQFYSRIIDYAKKIKDELDLRLSKRIRGQKRLLEEKELKYEELKKAMQKGDLDKSKIMNECIPIMEVSKCILECIENEAV